MELANILFTHFKLIYLFCEEFVILL